MVRELPKINILETEFLVDVRLQEFRESENPANRISFDLLTEDGDGYILLFDKETRNVQSMPADVTKPSSPTVWIKIPSLFVLDPVGMARLCGMPDHTYIPKYGSAKAITAEPIEIRDYGLSKRTNRDADPGTMKCKKSP